MFAVIVWKVARSRAGGGGRRGAEGGGEGGVRGEGVRGRSEGGGDGRDTTAKPPLNF